MSDDGGWLSTRRPPRDRRLRPNDVDRPAATQDGDGETASSSSSSPPTTRGAVPASLSPHLGWTMMSSHRSCEDRRRARRRRRRATDGDRDGGGGAGSRRERVAGLAVVSSFDSSSTTRRGIPTARRCGSRVDSSHR
ncbi:hypothetical protein ACHAW5_002872 [Stephanodiscus triporus]|uniref:Uncharacterized protein n=1 Tax=Stephanodiscus triporus TaxID=2934178 RepID=A0ABD3PAE2_9STRA